MSKRELEKLSSTVDVDAPRAKRRKEAPAATPQDDKQDVKMGESVPPRDAQQSQESEVDPEKLELVKEQGLKLWQVLKDAVDKDGRHLAHDFHRLPSKRLYPDYYELIKRPISLEDIKSQLESGAYTSLDAAKVDFELVFRNAKRYNARDSQIWNDAKALHKLVTSEYKRMTGIGKNGDTQQDDGGGTGDEGAPKKKKAPSMNRLLTSKLDKLVGKTDDNGDTLAGPFMELPSRKQWPLYYKTIQKPMCFETIFKHLKRKEYPNPAAFAADVELVFSNAFQFNEDHTPIWESAQTLKNYFHKLMSDLPEPYAIPQYSSVKDTSAPSNGKIRIKVTMPGQNHTPAPTAKSGKGTGSATPLMLKVPAGNAAHGHLPGKAIATSTKPTPSATPASFPASSPLATAPPITAPTPQHAQSAAQSFSYPNPSYTPGYAHAGYQQGTPAQNGTPAAGTSAAAVAPPPPVTPSSMSYSPAPLPARAQHPLKSVSLTIMPGGRRLLLDHRDAVKSWALRLGPGENGVRITDVNYLGGSEEEESSDSDEEEEEEEAEEEGSQKKGKGKQMRSTSRRKAGAVRIKDGVKLPPKHAPPEIQVKLDASVLKQNSEDEDEWDVDLAPGMHVFELGEKGGPVWKVYVDGKGS
ncbi:hypothetical protein EWM64_g664 [Hericium alpestre]|uniref:Bromo domain-containing protein n=1 Tax=Hericium alpestre TaxID=135208 RepID=A0A4Z0A9F5_9AGAM|nr:hypothetical protein EWM64_g664 [Hericium alpestre]